MNQEDREKLRTRLEIGFYIITIVATVFGLWFANQPVRQTPPQKVIVEIEQVRPAKPAPPGLQGWSPESAEAMQDWTDQQARFRIVARGTGEPVSQDNTKANVRLWKLVALNVAQPPPNGPQLTGDCTSWSSAHAIESTQGAQLAAIGGTWKRVFPPWLYGAGRAWIWRNQIIGPMPSEGCSVAAIARAAQEFGVLSWDDAKSAGYEYSGQLADQWGRSGPPAKLKAVAAEHKLLNIAPLRSAAELRDAVCNGYGTAFGSDFTAFNFHATDGRIVADNETPRLGKLSPDAWHHALCCDGYDGTGSQPWYHIQNSWYPTSHPQPIDDSPVCGFWVSEQTIEYIVAQKDAFAFADFEGFIDRKQTLDLFSNPVGGVSAPSNSVASPNVEPANRGPISPKSELSRSTPSKTRMSP